MMDDKGQYEAAVESCEMAARSHGHALGKWYPVDERLHVSMCEVCGAMVLVARPGGEERWRTGGKAFEQGCLEEEEDRRFEFGA
jgi:hypothetical protein